MPLAPGPLARIDSDAGSQPRAARRTCCASRRSRQTRPMPTRATAAADWLVERPAVHRGIDASKRRPTIRPSHGGRSHADGPGPHLLVLRSLRRAARRSARPLGPRPLRPADRRHRPRAASSGGAAPRTTKGQLDDLCRGLPRLDRRTWLPALQDHLLSSRARRSPARHRSSRSSRRMRMTSRPTSP